MESRMAEYFPEARLIAFSSGEEETDFLADRHYVTGGLTLMTSELPVEQGKGRHGLPVRAGTAADRPVRRV